MEYTVKPEEAGRRVRDILRRSMEVSYTAMKSAKWNGRIRLNGEPAATDAIVQAGDTVRIDWADDTPAYRPRRFDVPLEVPWEDEHLMAVVKPAPLASQSSRKCPRKRYTPWLRRALSSPASDAFSGVSILSGCLSRSKRSMT